MALPSQIIPSRREANNFTSLRFPLDIGPIGMVFNFKRYEFSDVGRTFSTTQRLSSSIVLPIPENIENIQGVIIDKADMGLGGALAAEAISGLQEGGVAGYIEGAAAGLQNMGEGFVDNIINDGIGDSFIRGASYLARRSLDRFGVGVGIEQATGTAINPHAALQFDGVPLKEFQFAWRLAPKSEKESAVIRDIERKIKQSMLPYYVGLDGTSNPTSGSALDRAFLNYPDICEISFVGINPDYYFRFKPGMIAALAVNYSSQGNVILKGGKPGVVTINMTFREARIHTREDYGGSGSGQTTG